MKVFRRLPLGLWFTAAVVTMSLLAGFLATPLEDFLAGVLKTSAEAVFAGAAASLIPVPFFALALTTRRRSPPIAWGFVGIGAFLFLVFAILGKWSKTSNVESNRVNRRLHGFPTAWVASNLALLVIGAISIVATEELRRRRSLKDLRAYDHLSPKSR